MTDPQPFSVSQFTHPRLAVPSPLMMSEPGSFAELTLNQRWPAIARRVLQENNFPSDINHNLERLVQDLFDGEVRSLQDPGPDVAAWDDYLKSYLGKPWLEVPWFFAEVYFYRRLLEATQYFLPGQWQGFDPFGSQKQAGLEMASVEIRSLGQQMQASIAQTTPETNDLNLLLLIYSSLWGNRADLSLQPTDTAFQVQQGVQVAAEQTHILADDTPALLDRLAHLQQARIDLVADNAGSELACDLYLIDFLLTQNIAGMVHLHLKAHPTFVSDAAIADVHYTLTVLATDPDPQVQQLAQRLQAHITTERLQLRADWFWTSPLAFWQMPVALQQDLVKSALVIIKGDANYRRLLGDCHWLFTTPFAEVVCYFPAPLVALRTVKSEVAAGLQLHQIERLNQEDPQWLVNGRWGGIQSANLT